MNIDLLKAIKKIVAHDNCPDGRASALIIHDVLPDAEIEFVQYQTPRHKTMTPEPGVLFVDFSPWAEREPPSPENKNPPMTEAGKATIQAWVDAGTLVLDHHKGADDILAMFGDRGVFADEKSEPGVSGATLAWREVWAPLYAAARKHLKKGKSKDDSKTALVEHFARVAGVRDTWQKESPLWEESGNQSAAVMFWPWEKLLQAGVQNVKPLLEIGSVLRQRDFERDSKTINEAYSIEFAGKKILCFEGLHTSDIADRVEADLVIGWHYLRESDGLKMVFSCRSRGDFSALDFAKAHGGGGHFHAAGFKVPIKPENTAVMLVPYGAVEFLIGKYLAPEQFAAKKSVTSSAAGAAAGAGASPPG